MTAAGLEDWIAGFEQTVLLQQVVTELSQIGIQPDIEA